MVTYDAHIHKGQLVGQQYKVVKRSKLLPYLFETLEGWSKKTIKQRLQSGGILVNGAVQAKHDFILAENDIIEMGSSRDSSQYNTSKQITPRKLEIIYQDRDLIAINKPAGLLSVGTVKDNKNHTLALLRTQLKRNKDRVQLWPVHRLDRDTSGILLFATSKETRESVMSEWNKVTKVYLAVVDGVSMQKAGSINEPLRLDNKEYRIHVGTHRDAKPATTHYKLIKQKNTRSLLEVQIKTGRQHQIRAHMSWMGNPIVGDERYGSKPASKKDERMGLHAAKLSFTHPINQKRIDLEIDAPQEFYRLLD